jgi:hypothetical protein
MGRQKIVASIVAGVAVANACLSLPQRAGENIADAILRARSRSEGKGFAADIRRYDDSCGRQTAIYRSTDIEAAKRALQRIVELSLAERQKATRDGPFNVMIAFSLARLAVIAELQNQPKEAERLFTSASVYRVLEIRAWNRERGYKKQPETKRSPDEWRHIISLLEKRSHPKWNSGPNQAPR